MVENIKCIEKFSNSGVFLYIDYHSDRDTNRIQITIQDINSIEDYLLGYVEKELPIFVQGDTIYNEILSIENNQPDTLILDEYVRWANFMVKGTDTLNVSLISPPINTYWSFYQKHEWIAEIDKMECNYELFKDKFHLLSEEGWRFKCDDKNTLQILSQDSSFLYQKFHSHFEE